MLFIEIISGLFRMYVVYVSVAKRQKGERFMKDNLKKVGAKVYLYEKDALIKKITYVYEDGTQSENYLDLFISICLQTQFYSERNVKFDFLSILILSVCMIQM